MHIDLYVFSCGDAWGCKYGEVEPTVQRISIYKKKGITYISLILLTVSAH